MNKFTFKAEKITAGKSTNVELYVEGESLSAEEAHKIAWNTDGSSWREPGKSWFYHCFPGKAPRLSTGDIDNVSLILTNFSSPKWDELRVHKHNKAN